MYTSDGGLGIAINDSLKRTPFTCFGVVVLWRMPSVALMFGDDSICDFVWCAIVSDWFPEIKVSW